LFGDKGHSKKHIRRVELRQATWLLNAVMVKLTEWFAEALNQPDEATFFEMVDRIL